MTIDDESSIYVGGLPYDATKDSIHRVFELYGAILDVKVKHSYIHISLSLSLCNTHTRSIVSLILLLIVVFILSRIQGLCHGLSARLVDASLALFYSLLQWALFYFLVVDSLQQRLTDPCIVWHLGYNFFSIFHLYIFGGVLAVIISWENKIAHVN